MANSSAGALAQTFTFSSKSMRVIVRDGEPWFVAADVCEALTIGNVSLAVNGRPGRTDSGLDEDEKGIASVNTLGGDQEMAIINESGLYSLILTSRKPEAKKFKKWVTSEVLPSIRKTGAYVAPNAPQATTTPPARVAEYLRESDLMNIKRRIWFCVRGYIYEGTWTQGIWFYLRQITGVPSPHQFNVDHLPTLAVELHRIHAISSQVQDIIRDIETQAVKRIFRKGEAEDVVLADLKRSANAAMLQVNDDVAKLPSYFQRDHLNLLQRHPHCDGVNYGTDEKPGYFDKAAA